MISGKNITTSNGKNLYLATFEKVIGEYGQIFVQAFYAKDTRTLEREIHRYLLAYYGDGNVSEVNPVRKDVALNLTLSTRTLKLIILSPP